MNSPESLQLDAYMVGDFDDKGARITRIYIKNPNHLIYETNNSGDIGMMMKNPSRYNWTAISPYTARISTLLNSKREKKAFLPNLAKAYHDFFADNTEAAIALFRVMEQDIIRHKRVVGKLNYLLTCLAVVGLMSLIGGLYHFLGWQSFYPELRTYIAIAILGSFGGFLSVSIRINQLQLDLEAGSFLPRITALTRMFMAILSSLIALIVIRSNLIFGVLNESTNPYVVYTLAVLAGFSESFIPNVLSRVEKQETADETG